MAIMLTEHIRPLRGGSQPHLMRAADGNDYVVKFQNNPQGSGVLVNEMLAAKLAGLLGLQAPTTAVVELPLELSKELYFESPSGRRPIRPGLHLGSRLVVNSLEGRSYDSLPQKFWYLIRNADDLVGIQIFDLWTCNRDTRQTVFWKYCQEKKYTATFIDNGHCFGGPEWKFSPLTIPSTDSSNLPSRVARVRWFNLISTFPTTRFEGAEADLIPAEWCGGKHPIELICNALRVRQAIIAKSIVSAVNKLRASPARSFINAACFVPFPAIRM